MADTRPKAPTDADVLNPENYRSIYPKAVLDALAKELGIGSREARLRFEDAVLSAAGVYKAFENSNELKVPRHRETQALEKVAKKANELSEAILETRQTGLAYPRLVGRGMPNAKSAASARSSPRFQQVLQIIVHGDADHMTMSPDIIQETVQFVRDAATTAAADESAVHTTYRNFPVEQWLRVLGKSWKEYSDLPFTVGRYYPDVGYENRTLYVLQELMDPLDEETTRQQIESALRKVTREISRNGGATQNGHV